MDALVCKAQFVLTWGNQRPIGRLPGTPSTFTAHKKCLMKCDFASNPVLLHLDFAQDSRFHWSYKLFLPRNSLHKSEDSC